VERSGMECFSVVKEQMPEFGLAQPDRVCKVHYVNSLKRPLSWRKLFLSGPSVKSIPLGHRGRQENSVAFHII
jgi:hypothetical protein